MWEQVNNQSDRAVLSLSDVLFRLGETVRSEFSSPFWLRADISKLNFYQYSGHCYPELVEKDNGIIVAQTKAIIWKNDFQRINDKFIQTVREPLRDGISIVCLARLTFHSLYGLSLIISDIDPDIALGQLEKERLACIQRLKDEGLFSLNSTKTLPLLPKRLAVISVISSKGYNDFIQTIETKSDKYRYFIHLFPSLLQGDGASLQLTEALNTVNSVKEYFDCVLIIRGGGGDIGLNCYNNYELCRTIAQFPIPVLTGIGHSTNETVAESVSYKSFITPTALAEFILGRFEDFENSLIDLKQRINRTTYSIIKEEYKALSYSKDFLLTATKHLLAKHKLSLQNDIKYLNAINPLNILNKGYSITLHNNTIIKSSKQITKGDKIETITSDGRFTSIVE